MRAGVDEDRGAEGEERVYSSLVVRIPVDLHQATKQRAARDDRSLAQTVRRALRLYLEDEGAA